MWIIAKKPFTDKFTKEKYPKGKKLNFKKERAEDCINRGLAKPAE